MQGLSATYVVRLEIPSWVLIDSRSPLLLGYEDLVTDLQSKVMDGIIMSKNHDVLINVLMKLD
jgi:hypothetical protein